jgi:hypothetical protein
MDQFTLRIELGNAAMQLAGDVAEALRRVADDVEAGETSGVVMDANGNTVGGWEGAPEP